VPLLILAGTDRLYKRFGNTTSKHKIVPASFITSGERVCLSVFVLSAREHNSRTTRPIFTDRIFVVPSGRGSVFFGSVAICYVLPVLWMTSFFYLCTQWPGATQKLPVLKVTQQEAAVA